VLSIAASAPSINCFNVFHSPVSNGASAGTVNAAHALGLADAGRLEVGLQADFLVLEGSDWRELVYMLGGNPVREVWIRGERLQV